MANVYLVFINLTSNESRVARIKGNSNCLGFQSPWCSRVEQTNSHEYIPANWASLKLAHLCPSTALQMSEKSFCDLAPFPWGVICLTALPIFPRLQATQRYCCQRLGALCKQGLWGQVREIQPLKCWTVFIYFLPQGFPSLYSLPSKTTLSY